MYAPTHRLLTFLVASKINRITFSLINYQISFYPAIARKQESLLLCRAGHNDSVNEPVRVLNPTTLIVMKSYY